MERHCGAFVVPGVAVRHPLSNGAIICGRQRCRLVISHGRCRSARAAAARRIERYVVSSELHGQNHGQERTAGASLSSVSPGPAACVSVKGCAEGDHKELVVRAAEVKDIWKVSELLVASFDVVNPLFSGWLREYFFRIAVIEYFVGAVVRTLLFPTRAKVLVAGWRSAEPHFELAGTIELTTIPQSDAVISYPFPLAEAFESPLEPKTLNRFRRRKVKDDLPYMQNLAVDSAARRGGVGRALVKACEEIARGQGHAAVYLHYLEAAETPARFWTSMGYMSLARDNLDMLMSIPFMTKLLGLEVRRFAGKHVHKCGENDLA